MTAERVPDEAARKADEIYASYQRGEVSKRSAVPELMGLLVITRGEANTLLDDAVKPHEPQSWHDMRTEAEMREAKMRDLTQAAWVGGARG